MIVERNPLKEKDSIKNIIRNTRCWGIWI